MMPTQVYGLTGFGVMGITAIIMLLEWPFSRNPDIKEQNVSASAAAFLDTDHAQREDTSPEQTSIRQEATKMTMPLVLAPGDTLLGVLTEAGIPTSEAYAAINRLKGLIDLRTLKVGQRLDLIVSIVSEKAKERRLENLTLLPETDRLIVVQRTSSNSFDAQTQQIKHSARLISVSGVVDTSLYEAVRKQEVPQSILLQLYDVMGLAVDFQRDIREGDRFALGYERFDDGDYEQAHPGKLSYVSVTLADRKLSYFRYKTREGFTGFFDAKGNSVQTNLIKTPVDGGQLSSLFGQREHPVLGYTRMHKGLDFAAPRGTPVLAAGDGIVTQLKRKGSFGKYISIRHDNRYSTAYAHLSKYKDNVEQGRRVRQGEVIGYVGATGLVSGPNLHYEVMQDGKQVNPMTVELSSRQILTDDELARFRRTAKRLLQDLKIKAPKNTAQDESYILEEG
ncbi:MAG: M23 family metallopeptidase [Thalassospira sp.]|uniref:M23 family metallopeptidase n=1 Tax=Thalassospira sp. TaxID=1912094 RepID=UPI0032F0523B|tara:strand:- start:3096 stop:4445 length:1350 start_codon:yes stop_codon:yes gene_type:complete